MTGESMPVAKQADAKVYAATVNQQGLLRCRAISVGAHTQLAVIIRLIEEAQGSKADPAAGRYCFRSIRAGGGFPERPDPAPHMGADA